jgi:aryl-alcohol dehydrogenase-like predicted oxidoreductase
MLPGSATIEGTQAYAAGHSDIAFEPLGATGLLTSAAGFGCYRVTSGVAEHEAAMRLALRSGVNLIDTSVNYADGGSEQLVGQVLAKAVDAGELHRDQVIVVSKAGYLQGGNFALSQARKREGRGFSELVAYGEGLEHCIHPDFLEDQLTRSLQRLNLETLDVFLLHNPEYYLSWARKKGLPLPEAREIYYQRLNNAFLHLEKEVQRGRIRWYGVSSNTFGADAQDHDFTSLHRLLDSHQGLPDRRHLAVIQMPLNLLEPGAVLNANQPGGQSVLDLARHSKMAVLINRPLNAMDKHQIMRLAEIKAEKIFSDDEIINAIGAFRKSEQRFVRRILPRLEIPVPMMQRVADQLCVGDQLKFYWRNFGSYERWRQAKAGFFLPRVQGVLQFLTQFRDDVEGAKGWMDQHHDHLTHVLEAVESLYAGGAKRQVQAMRRSVREADRTWGEGRTLSQMAVRALRATLGVTSVLVGMRQTDYVQDVLEELRRPVQQTDRSVSWSKLAADEQQ